MRFIDTLMSSVALGEVASEMMMKIDILHVLDTHVCALPLTHSAVVLIQGHEFKSSLQTFILGCVLLYVSRNTSEIC